jgi:hypothetical protein
LITDVTTTDPAAFVACVVAAVTVLVTSVVVPEAAAAVDDDDVLVATLDRERTRSSRIRLWRRPKRMRCCPLRTRPRSNLKT